MGQDLWPLLSATLAPLLASGRIWKIQFDTYEREIERYGGIEGVAAAEEIFSADSEAVLTILRATTGDGGFDKRWRMALLGVDRLLGDCGLDLEARRASIQRQRDAFQREFHAGLTTRKQLGERYRAERRKLEALFENPAGPGDLAELARAFDVRSLRIVEAVRRMRPSAEALPALVDSYVHMHINRMIRSAQRTHELVLYDYLFRIYDGQLARAGKTGRSAAEPDAEAVGEP
jgi:lantibiotic biosynthesis protein